MSEALTVDPINSQPQTIFLKDYQPPAFLIDEINLTFDLWEEHTEVTSKMRIRHNRKSTNKTRDLILDGEDLKLISIKLDNVVLEPDQYEITNHFLLIPNVPDNFELEIINHIYPHKNTALMGLYQSQKTYCTQCEAEGFRRITYYLDHPDILARFTTLIRAHCTGYPYLLSNGNLVAEGVLEDGGHWAKWEDPFKKPSYLFALVAGDFDLIKDNFTTQSAREISLQVYVEKGYGDQAHHAIYCLQEAMRWDEKAYGREYDLDIYMIVAIGDFNMGAMENKGLNIFNTKYILAKPDTATDDDYIHILSVVGHEYFHNWSGNRVTCRDWFQLSLKEGLTIFRDQSFSEDTLSKAVMRIHEVNQLREFQFSEDAGPLSHPVRPESYIEINNFYTSTVYNKGAEVLRMLQTILGPTLFRKGMDLYFARHDGQAVTIEDYVKTMEDVSGLDLAQFRLWYSQAGTPQLTAQDEFNAHENTYTLTISQKTLPTANQPNKLPLFIPIKVSLLDGGGKELALHLNNEPIANEKVLQLKTESQTYRFKNISHRPYLSLLRNFSAPVKLNYSYSDAELHFLYKFDTDAFNRWEAGQTYTLRLLLELIQQYQHQKELVFPNELANVFEYTLRQTDDKFFLSELLVLPTEKYIAEQMQVVDVNALHHVREFLMLEIAKALQTRFHEVYVANHEVLESYVFSMEAVGKRKLKNRCLFYLMLLPQYFELGVKQFNDSLKNNMTDTEAALMAINHIDSPLRDKALEEFYQTWKHDALVMDKWFAIQATTKLPNALQQVKNLTRHPAFDIKNPNKVYSLIGAFGQRNLVSFHAENGEGYAFLRETVKRLDKLNPQVSARMVKPLTSWKRYDKDRQKLMYEQLEILLQDTKISRDLYELVSKSLE